MILNLVLAVVGAALVGLPAHWFRIDSATCAAWPSVEIGVSCAVVYAAGVALLTVAWVRIALSPVRSPTSLRWVVLGGVVVHLVSLVGLPYLSQDPLFYAAVGRSMTVHGAGPGQPLSQVLPPDDPFLAPMPATWRDGTSPYGPGFHLVARAVAAIGGGELWLHLRLYQVIGLLCMLAAALIVAAAARRPHDDDADPGAPARAAALVLFCPLAVVEGTQSGHNDGFIAVATAGFAWAFARRRPALGTAALVTGLLTKLSALLWIGVNLVQIAADRWRRIARDRRAHLYWAGVALAAAAVALLAFAQREWLLAQLRRVTALLDDPNASLPYCTRSIECLPRALLRWWSGDRWASWALGLGFRVVAGIWLVFMAVRSHEPDRRLGGLATALVIFYLYLHAWAQSWYLLPLLPLLPFVDRARRAPMLVYCVTATLYYALTLPLGCPKGELWVGISEILETIVTIVPPTLVLARRRSA